MANGGDSTSSTSLEPSSVSRGWGIDVRDPESGYVRVGDVRESSPARGLQSSQLGAHAYYEPGLQRFSDAPFVEL